MPCTGGDVQSLPPATTQVPFWSAAIQKESKTPYDARYIVVGRCCVATVGWPKSLPATTQVLWSATWSEIVMQYVWSTQWDVTCLIAHLWWPLPGKMDRPRPSQPTSTETHPRQCLGHLSVGVRLLSRLIYPLHATERVCVHHVPRPTSPPSSRSRACDHADRLQGHLQRSKCYHSIATSFYIKCIHSEYTLSTKR